MHNLLDKQVLNLSFQFSRGIVKNFVKAFVVAGAAVAALAVPGVAMAAQDVPAAQSTSVGAADVRLFLCGESYQNCVQNRYDMVRRGYKVSEIKYYPYDPSCAGICYHGYMFDYWK